MPSKELQKHLDKAKGKINVQGMARKSIELMRHVGPDPGFITVSSDAGAGEPSVNSHFSKDKNYMYACFDGVGKAPFYQGPVMMIDDIYLMGMSISPFGKDVLRSAFQQRWPAGSFQDQWLADPEVIKDGIKTARQQHKILILGCGYGMGPKKMVKQAYDFGFQLSLRDAKAFHKNYWTLFSGVKRLADKLAYKVENDGHIINPFGYRLTPSPHKALNYFIQSSVSGLLHVYTAKLMAAAPWARYVTCIHDELILDVPEDRLEEFAKAKTISVDSLNDDLGWDIKIRMGFKPGNNWFTAH